MNTLHSLYNWHSTARPTPSTDALAIQAGCHLEEVVEMLRALEPTLAIRDAAVSLEHLSKLWKSREHYPVIADRREFLDSLADQIVTAVGVGYCANMDVAEACERVDTSNWSKFIDGRPMFNSQGKITKSETYAPPDLTGLY